MEIKIDLHVSDDVVLLLIAFLCLAEDEQLEILRIMEYGDDN